MNELNDDDDDRRTQVRVFYCKVGERWLRTLFVDRAKNIQPSRSFDIYNSEKCIYLIDLYFQMNAILNVCVCVCVRERESERDFYMKLLFISPVLVLIKKNLKSTKSPCGSMGDLSAFLLWQIRKY
jgi:hypothetical protein